MTYEAVDAEEVELRVLLEAINLAYGYDFRGYAPAYIRRRLWLACQRLGCHSLSQLQEKLLHDSQVFSEVLPGLVVKTSEMFRDAGFFRGLREKVIPHLRTYPFVRVWVAGCSTGEEFYSLAILFREEGLESRSRFYATDIDVHALRRAEAGIYSLDRIPSFTANHQLSGGRCSLSEYYTAAYGAARFDKSLRERAVFADHSLVSDSVFAEVQLVICRNVLIYFTRPLRDRAIGLFREALVRRGFLGIGASETLRLTGHGSAFEEFIPAQRIYQKRGEA